MSFNIPDVAPFNDTQRMWLKGFFDGLGERKTASAMRGLEEDKPCLGGLGVIAVQPPSPGLTRGNSDQA